MTKILLDTQALLFCLQDSPKLSKRAKKIFLDKNNELFLSMASLWEIAIKISLGKLTLTKPIDSLFPDQLRENGIKQLDIQFRHITKVATLPFHHRDPFDRLLIAQSLVEKMPLLSSDTAFDHYNISRYW